MFGLSDASLEKIIIAIGASIITAVISLLFQRSLAKREARLILVRNLTERRIAAYEEIIKRLDYWGQVNRINPDVVDIVLIATGFKNPLTMMRSQIMRDYQSLIAFMNEWNQTFQNVHLFTDKGISIYLIAINTYLSELINTFDLSCYELNLKDVSEEEEEGMAVSLCDAFQAIGAELFPDYFIFAKPIYKKITKFYSKPKLKVTSNSVRDFKFLTSKKLRKLMYQTALVRRNIEIRHTLLSCMGLSEDEIRTILDKKASIAMPEKPWTKILNKFHCSDKN